MEDDGNGLAGIARGGFSLRRIISIWVARFVMNLAKLLGHKGTNLGGEVALRIYPRILARFGDQVKGKILFVTGTNGKTTTNNMIFSIIRESGASCVANKLGANLDAGLISAFIESSDLLGNVDADYACLEVDESTLPKVMRQLKPHAILFTNIFQERRSRQSRVDIILNKIKVALEGHEEIDLIINADDPNLVDFGESLPHTKYYYGVDSSVEMGQTLETRKPCGACGKTLVYHHQFYADLGHFTCKNCGFKRPRPDYTTSLKAPGTGLIVEGLRAFKADLEVELHDRYSIFNISAAVAFAAIESFDPQTIEQGLQKYTPQLGRMEEFNLNKPVILNLAKNPVGFDETMRVLAQDPRPKLVVLGINNLPQDGTDVSWLWDTKFEILQEAWVDKLAVFGQCSGDMVQRLTDAGFKSTQITTISSTEEVVEFVARERAPVVYVLVNYSLLFEVRDSLKKKQRSK